VNDRRNGQAGDAWDDGRHAGDTAASVSLQCHPDAMHWAEAAAAEIAQALAAQLQAQDSARLLLSGGSTPDLVHRRLAHYPLPWNRISIGLVDERWGPPGHAGSNAALLQAALRDTPAHAARFTPLIQPDMTLEAAVDAANARAYTDGLPCLAVLGMGEDGHIASLFPGAASLLPAFADPRTYAAFDATGCAVAAPWPQRITLTPAGLMRTGARMLLIRGDTKREVLQRALVIHDPLRYPVRVAITAPQACLRVHWCP